MAAGDEVKGCEKLWKQTKKEEMRMFVWAWESVFETLFELPHIR